ncbi:MAG: hypothetical protein CL859_06015 [Cyanobium sp. ARS6]|nr:hypothetical protein [Cyanobium sp. ARS6]
MSLSRRELIASAGLTGIAAIGLNHSSFASELPDQVDVVVVGAGLSGLMAARQLKQNGKNIHILEARNRTGGRMVRKLTDSGHFVDLGGQWGGQSHHRFRELVSELGLETFPVYKEGKASLVWNNKNTLADVAADYDEGLLFLDSDQIGQTQEEVDKAKSTLKLYQELVKTVDHGAPWKTPNAVELDRITIESWLKRHSDSPLSTFMLEILSNVGGSGGFDAWDASMLHSIWTQAISPQRDYPESWLIKGAAGQVAELLTEELTDHITLNSPVICIEQDDNSVQVTDGYGRKIFAKAAIVAIPPPLRQRISFRPALRAETRSFLQRNPMGSMIKVLAIYDKAFWRQKGMSGLGIGNQNTLQFMADSSPPDGNPGVIASFITAGRAVEFQQLTDNQQKSSVLSDLAAYFGPDAAQPKELILQNWNQEDWSSGAFTSYVTPGAWTTYGEYWQEPHGRVHWAGTEASTRWRGYLEGALEAAAHAADSIRRHI